MKEIRQPSQSQLLNSSAKKSSLEFDKYDVCIKCNNLYHQACFNKKKNSILCKDCEGVIKSNPA